jgi:hypothetical protein
VGLVACSTLVARAVIYIHLNLLHSMMPQT